MNYPNATPTDWTDARRIVSRYLQRSGYDAERAEEVAQAWTVALLTKNHSRACPINPRVAAFGAVKLARRRGPAVLDRPLDRAMTRRRRGGLEEAQPTAEPVPVAHHRNPLDPATMAEAGEGLAARMPRFAAAARARGVSPATLALQAAGWGEGMADAPVHETGPGYTPPTQGAPGLHLAVDPNPASRAAAALDAANDARRVAGLPPIR